MSASTSCSLKILASRAYQPSSQEAAPGVEHNWALLYFQSGKSTQGFCFCFSFVWGKRDVWCLCLHILEKKQKVKKTPQINPHPPQKKEK